MISAAGDASRPRHTTLRPPGRCSSLRSDGYKLRHMTSVQESGRLALLNVLAVADGQPRTERPISPSAGVLPAEVRAWIADPAQGVAATAVSVEGAQATREALATLVPSQPVVTATVSTERACWAEFTARGVGDPETGVVG